MRISAVLLLGTLAFAPDAHAQASDASPLVLFLPASARATGLGNAAVAIRDEYAVFYNPAQINTGQGALAGFTSYGGDAMLATLTGATTVNWLTLGWGVEAVKYSVGVANPYPFAPAELTRPGSRDALSLVLGAGGNFLVKGFRAGIGVKYVEDRVAGGGLAGAGRIGVPAILNGLLLADVGVSHSLLSGQAALSVQHIGDPGRSDRPMQETLGWARQMQARQLDLGFAAQVTERNRSVYAGGGVEVGYGWIEGWSAALRAGARRTETTAQRPVSVGGTLNADHLVVDYALEFFERSGYAHHVSLRWRP